MDFGNKPVLKNLTARANSRLLLGLAGISCICYGMLTALSFRFQAEVPTTERPTWLMLGLFFLAFVCYWAALGLVVRRPAGRQLSLSILASSALFRLLMLPSVPMHEIDIYRYLWDGAVVTAGVSPYRYAPQEVLPAASAQRADRQLDALVSLRARSASLAESLGRIHYAELPSPYPPVSQAVFALAAVVTPDQASTFSRVLMMKGLLVLLDLATLLVVMQLVQRVGLHPGWSLAYGWCPLVLKEFANGGHLDTIAVFCSMLAIWLLVKTLAIPAAARPSLRGVLVTGSALALAVGAKLYPLVLLPLFAALWWRRAGQVSALLGVGWCGGLCWLLLSPLVGPLLPATVPAAVPAASTSATTGQPSPSQNLPPSVPAPTTEPAAGIRKFLQQWEMNDLIFMVVLENLRSSAHVAADKRPWFVVVPADMAETWVRRGTALLDRFQSPQPSAQREEGLSQQWKADTFRLARLLTGGGFVCFACVLAWRAAGHVDPRQWCRAAMLTLAWFWLTSPTQNPWYWCWVVPLLPFARYRTWYVVGAATLLYYLRFWLTAHYPQPPVWGTAYNGTYFFYFVIAWVEFLPCLAGLSVEFWLGRWRKSATSNLN